MDNNQLKECLDSGTKVKYTGQILRAYSDSCLEIIEVARGGAIALVMDVQTKNRVWIKGSELTLF